MLIFVQIQSHSPDGDIVTPGNFDKHMEAQPTHRLLKSVQVSKLSNNHWPIYTFIPLSHTWLH